MENKQIKFSKLRVLAVKDGWVDQFQIIKHPKDWAGVWKKIKKINI